MIQDYTPTSGLNSDGVTGMLRRGRHEVACVFVVLYATANKSQCLQAEENNRERKIKWENEKTGREGTEEKGRSIRAAGNRWHTTCRIRLHNKLQPEARYCTVSNMQSLCTDLHCTHRRWIHILPCKQCIVFTRFWLFMYDSIVKGLHTRAAQRSWYA